MTTRKIWGAVIIGALVMAFAYQLGMNPIQEFVLFALSLLSVYLLMTP